MMKKDVGAPLQLACGWELPNRLVKAAMTEGLADSWNHATPSLCRLYQTWASGSIGLVITGNVVVDRRFVEQPGNLAIEMEQTEEELEKLKTFARACKENDTKCIVQLSHAGRQASKLVNKHLKGPSAIPMNDPNPMAPSDSTTGALTVEEIADVRKRFIHAAQVSVDVGFDGVQVHAAHGYLLSSFLNPLANVRTDQYGGSLENRARLLLEIVEGIRTALGPSKCVSVKINSADFQKSGFTTIECAKVVEMLDPFCDFIEISGGNYESPVMIAQKAGEPLPEGNQSRSKNQSTIQREAFFLEFANEIRPSLANAKLMVTGGFRSRATMDEALENNELDLIGVGRPLCVDPECCAKLLQGSIKVFPAPEREFELPWYFFWLYPFKIYSVVTFFSQQTFCYEYLEAIGEGKERPSWSHVMHVFRNLRKQEKQAADLKNLNCVGTHHNSHL